VDVQVNAEQAVLGAILRSNSVYREAAKLITGADFANPHMGAVFDGIGRLVATGESVDATTVEVHFPAWEVRGLSSADPWLWLDAAPHPQVVVNAARIVRAGALRRRGEDVMSRALADIKDTGNDPATVIERVQRDLVSESRGELTSVTLADVLLTPDEQDWIVPGLLEAKDRLILTGHEGLGKTTLVRQLLILPAAGIHPFTFEPIEPVTALVVDAENTAKQWMRATRWMVGQAMRTTKRDPSHRIHMSLSGRLNLLDPTTLGDIHRLIDQHKPGLVFIGPLYRLALQMNTDEQISPVIAALDSIRDRGVALVIEAHAGHAVGVNGIRDVRPRGSSALLGWPEFGYGIRKDTRDDAPDSRFEFVAWRGARETRDWPTALRRGNWEMGDWPWLVDEEWQ
jgi:replicative DNA helicase